MTDYLKAASRARTNDSRAKFTRLAINTCTACELSTTRTNAVPWSGPTTAPIALVGEAPGAAEDKTGEPFVGRSGRLLDHCLAQAGIDRDDVMVFNTLCCRPPGNRDPNPIELQACQPNFQAQLNLSESTVVVLLGRSAVVNVFGDPKVRLSDIQGVPVWFEGGIWLPTYHPAYILRNRAMKGVLTSHLRLAKALVEGRHWPRIDPETVSFSGKNQGAALKKKLKRDKWAVVYSKVLGAKVLVLTHGDVAYPAKHSLLPVYTMEELAKVGEFGMRRGLSRDMVEKLHLVKGVFGGEIVA